LPPFDTTSRNGYTANGSAVRAEIVWLPFGWNRRFKTTF
jgi:hypothetical protein